MAQRRDPRQGSPLSPFETADNELELVTLDAVDRAAWETGDDFEVTVDEPESASAEASAATAVAGATAQGVGAGATARGTGGATGGDAAAEADGFDIDVEFDTSEDEALAAPSCPDVSDLDGALAEFTRAQHADTVLDLLAKPVVPGVSLTAVLIVREGVARGRRATGTRMDRSGVEGLVVPLAAPSYLWRAVEELGLVQGPVADDPMQQVISRYLRAPEPQEAAVAPVVLGGRVLNLVCVQTPLGRKLDASAVAALEALRTAAATAYLRLIRGKKTGGASARDGKRAR